KHLVRARGAVRVEEEVVGEGAADVDSDPVAHAHPPDGFGHGTEAILVVPIVSFVRQGGYAAHRVRPTPRRPDLAPAGVPARPTRDAVPRRGLSRHHRGAARQPDALLATQLLRAGAEQGGAVPPRLRALP